MIRNDPKIYALMYESVVDHISREKNIDIREARLIVSNMSFAEYHSLIEATLVQPTNTFSTIKSTYPNPIQVKQTREPTPDNDSAEVFGGLADPHDSDARADKVAKQRGRQSTIQNKDQPQQDQPGKVTLKQEDITPPSGDTIGPSTGSNQTSGATAQTAPGGVKSLWPGKGVPAAVGMTVGLKGPSGLPIPGQITQADNAAKGVKVKNPTTGQEEWVNIANLQPYIAQGQHQSQAAPPAQPDIADAQKTMEDIEILNRMRELAGIKETCSAGATGAGSIAIAPTPMGNIKRRVSPVAELKHEYTPDGAKTVIGDTKPNQASGKLSADLAASGKATASRINNGRKRRR